MPPGGGTERQGRRPGAFLSRAWPPAAAVLARAAPSGAPRVARRGPAADNALPGATSRAAARQTPAWRPPPRAGPSAPRPAPPGFPRVCQGRRARSAPASFPLRPPRPSLSPPLLFSRVSSPPFRVYCTQFLPRSLLVLCHRIKQGASTSSPSILLQPASQAGSAEGRRSWAPQRTF